MDAQDPQLAYIRNTRRQVLVETLREKGHVSTLSDLNTRVSELLLSFENHQRQLCLLAVSHMCITFFILVMALVGGHQHSADVIGIVYPGLFIAFWVALLAIGARTTHMWVFRAFALAFFALGVWSLAGVVYALLRDVRMRRWNDWLLLGAQLIDITTAIGYLWTVEQLAGIGGTISGELADAHKNGVLVTPHTAHLGDAASINAATLRSRFAWLFRLVRPHEHTE